MTEEPITAAPRDSSGARRWLRRGRHRPDHCVKLCEYCGDPYVAVHERRTRRQRFCSLRCSGRWVTANTIATVTDKWADFLDRGQMPEARIVKTCAGCGAQFTNDKRVSPANWRNKKFHDRACWAAHAKPLHAHRRTWTDEELDTLRRAYTAGGSPAAVEAMPHRTKEQIKNMANRLRLRSALTRGRRLRKKAS